MLEAAIIPSPSEDPVIITPTYLRVARTLLGMSQAEAATLLQITPDEARNLERGRTHFVFDGHANLVGAMLEQVNRLIETSTADGVKPPDFLITFPNDEVFHRFEPELASWMVFNTVHTMFIARLFDEWLSVGIAPVLLDLVPQQYAEFLKDERDSRERRWAWAKQHLRSVNVRQGMPSSAQGRIRIETRGED
jgi:transcriptional regulator with XRE-family HTH domain